MVSRVAVVTGANRGIGLEIVARLAREGLRVLLTARDATKGQTAATALAEQGLPVEFQRLDVTDASGARRLVKHLADEVGRLDVLVNNAAIYDGGGAPLVTVDPGLVRLTMETNFYGPLRLCQSCVPLMRRGGYGRVVNVSSGMGALTDMGRGAPAYRLSKAALNALTRVLAAEVAGENIKVNAVDPGWVATDMGGPRAPRTVAQGADTAVWLATLPDDGPSGGFFRDRRPRPW
ncbi:MAG: SDR family oxidoreductase [Candidatus Promineifilaceae bacterium]|nr:SDR family oxidoreductase [Candidatus Promineifilaceae bacterium]